jgi:hypothetical protein
VRKGESVDNTDADDGNRFLHPVAHTDAVSDGDLAHGSDSPAAVEERRQSDFRVSATDTDRRVILMARDLPSIVRGGM